MAAASNDATPDNDLRVVNTGQFKITPQNVSSQLLKDILEGAGVDAEINGKGHVALTSNGIKAFLALPDDQGRNEIRLWCIYGVADGISHLQQLEFANAWNDTYMLVRATVTGGVILFDHYVVIAEGCTVDHLIASMAQFFSMAPSIREFNTDGVLI